MIGYPALYETLSAALLPDLDLHVDEWSDRFMIIPKASGANEYGRYRTQRTPYAKRIMRALSDHHPCKRVVAMVASQMMKTQIGINFAMSSAHQSPSNFLMLVPTGTLQKRLATRVDKTVAAVPELREIFAKPNSRDAKNNLDVKEFVGGALFLATAGSAANLSEISARRVAIDEVDRCLSNVDGEGDPIKLAEARQTTFKHNRKSYYYSSPTIDGESKIAELYNQGTQLKALAKCIHCEHLQELIFENLIPTDDGVAMYPCESCGGMHQESDKTKMFGDYWSEPIGGDGETESFTASAMYMGYGLYSWGDMLREYSTAKDAQDKGNDGLMTVFYNTRLARVWKRTIQVISHETLIERAEHYPLQLAPDKVLFVTAAVDTQDNRLACQVIGWGRNLSAWILDYVEFPGDPANDQVWQTLTEYINAGIRHESGRTMPIIATGIDTGGHRTHAVRHYVRLNAIRNPIALFGSTSINAPPLKKGNAVDVIWKGIAKKKILIQYIVGTTDLKHDLYSRLKNDDEKELDDRFIHFSNELPTEYFAGLLSETYDRKTKRFEPKIGVRNEPLDTLIYNYAILHHPAIRAHRYTAKDWDQMAQNNKTITTPGKISLSGWSRGA